MNVGTMAAIALLSRNLFPSGISDFFSKT